jgi:hypothetical protein
MEPSLNQKRVAPRHRTFKGGKIRFRALGASIDCVIRNLSETGACLQVESQSGIPDTFELFTTEDRSVRTCRVVWRSANRIGVAFA